jgi:hypothetical protein
VGEFHDHSLSIGEPARETIFDDARAALSPTGGASRSRGGPPCWVGMDSDAFANGERTAGRTARCGNIVGNAWSYFYECITGCPSGW